MACKMQRRRDDIPKYRGEKSWVCEECGALALSKEKPTCRRVVAAEMQARRAFAFAEDMRNTTNRESRHGNGTD